MRSRFGYSVLVVVLEAPLITSHMWTAGVFGTYSEAEQCAKSIVENVLYHLEAALRSAGQELSAANLLAGYLESGEAPIIMGEGKEPQGFNFWDYANARAALLASDDEHLLQAVGANRKAVYH